MSHITRTRALSRRRGVTLVEVLIVVAIMAVVASVATVYAIPQYNKTRVRAAAIGAAAVRDAAMLHRDVDLYGDGASCPTVQELVGARKLAADRSEDPWGTRYNVTCDDEIHGVSSGRDRKLSTPDDVRDDVKKPADIERIAGM